MARETHATVHNAEDLVPVRSRVSWGAILSGAMVALAAFVLLSTLGAACGLTIGPNFNTAQGAGLFAAIWAVVTALLSMFLGGWVCSQCTAGENKAEAAFYGVILWGVMFSMLLVLTVAGASLGLNAMMGVANVVSNQVDPSQVQAATQNLNLSQAQIDQLGANLRTNVQPGARDAAWWTFAAMLGSILASVGGSLAGSGPEPYFRIWTMRSTRTATARA